MRRRASLFFLTVIYNEISIPSPAGELIETSLLAGLNYRCDFPLDGSCSAFVEMFIPELRPFPSTSSGYSQEVISSF